MIIPWAPKVWWCHRELWPKPKSSWPDHSVNWWDIPLSSSQPTGLFTSVFRPVLLRRVRGRGWVGVLQLTKVNQTHSKKFEGWRSLDVCSLGKVGISSLNFMAISAASSGDEGSSLLQWGSTWRSRMEILVTTCFYSREDKPFLFCQSFLPLSLPVLSGNREK